MRDAGGSVFRKPLKRAKPDIGDDFIVDNDQVQITASTEELDKRISTFIALKKAENDESNKVEFCETNDGSRTKPATIKRKQQIKLSKNESLDGPLNSTHSTTTTETTTSHSRICFSLSFFPSLPFSLIPLCLPFCASFVIITPTPHVIIFKPQTCVQI